MKIKDLADIFREQSELHPELDSYAIRGLNQELQEIKRDLLERIEKIKPNLK